MKEFNIKTEQETQEVAKELVKLLKGGELIALSGNLGAGKTVFVKALAKELGVKEEATSPTFVLMKVYQADHGKVDKFVHVDCYRLSGQEDLFEIGLGDYLNYDNTVVAVEWADKIANLPDKTIKVHIDILEGDQRKITIG